MWFFAFQVLRNIFCGVGFLDMFFWKFSVPHRYIYNICVYTIEPVRFPGDRLLWSCPMKYRISSSRHSNRCDGKEKKNNNKTERINDSGYDLFSSGMEEAGILWQNVFLLEYIKSLILTSIVYVVQSYIPMRLNDKFALYAYFFSMFQSSSS